MIIAYPAAAAKKKNFFENYLISQQLLIVNQVLKICFKLKIKLKQSQYLLVRRSAVLSVVRKHPVVIVPIFIVIKGQPLLQCLSTSIFHGITCIVFIDGLANICFLSWGSRITLRWFVYCCSNTVMHGKREIS